MLGSVTFGCIFIFSLFIRDVFQLFTSDFNENDQWGGNGRTQKEFNVLQSEVRLYIRLMFRYYLTEY